MANSAVKIAGVTAGTVAGICWFSPRFPLPYLLVVFVTLFWLQLCVYQLWIVTVYRFYFSPLRHLPQPPNDPGRFSWFLGQSWTIAEDPFGSQRRWIEEGVPNDGLLAYFAFGQPRVLVTSPSTLREVMVGRLGCPVVRQASGRG